MDLIMLLKYSFYGLWYFICIATASDSEISIETDLLHNIRNDFVRLTDKYSAGGNVPDRESIGLRDKRKSDIDGSDLSFWYSYTFGTGTGNREVLRVSGVHKENWLGDGCNGVGVWSWQSLEIGRNRGLLLGLGFDSLTLCSYSDPYSNINQQNGSPAYNATEFILGVNGLPTAAAMFKTWNETSKMTDVVIVVALNFNDQLPILVWYRVLNNGKSILSQLPTTWELQKSVWYLQSFKIRSDKKLLVLNHPKGKRKDTSVDLHGFIWEEEGKTDFWLVQKLNVHAESAIAIVNVGETVFLGISQPDEELIKLYQYDFVDHKFKIFQEIVAAKVSKLTSFHVGFSSFVAVAGEKPMLLRFDKEEFITERIDGIENLGSVLHWLPIPIRTYRDEVVLLAESESFNNRLISIVTWIGGHPGFSLHDPPMCYMNGIETQGLLCILDPVSNDVGNYGLESAAALSLGRWTPGLIIARSYGSSVLFRLEASLESVHSPVEKEVALLKQRQQELDSIIVGHSEVLEQAKNMFPEILDLDDNNIITGSWDIAGLKGETVEILDGDMTMKFCGEEDESTEWQIGGLVWCEDDLSFASSENLYSFELELENLKSSIEELKLEVSDAVPLISEENEPIVITAPQTFKGAITVNGEMKADDLYLDKLNGVSVEEILSNTVRLDRPKKIDGHKILKSLSVENLQVFEKLGSIDVSSLVFSDDDVTIMGGLTYENKLHVVGDVILPEGGKVNDLDLSEDIVSVNGTYDFGIEFDSIVAIDVTADKANFPVEEDFFLSIMREKLDEDREQIIESSLTLNYLEALGDNVEIEKINGYNLNDFLSKLVLVKEGAYIPGETVIEECYAMKDVDIKYLNGLKFPDEYVQKYGDQVITGRKKFLSENGGGSLKADVLKLSGLINGISTQDLVTSSTDQELPNTSFQFTDLEVVHLKVIENIEGIPVKDYKRPPMLGEHSHKLMDVYFRDLNVTGNVIVNGSLDGYYLENILGEVIYDDLEDIVVNVSKMFVKDLNVDTLDLEGLINGLNVSGFLTTDTEQNFVGEKIIGKGVKFNNIEVKDGLVDGVDIAYLAENAVRLSGHVLEDGQFGPEMVVDNIYGSITFEDDVFVSPSMVFTSLNDFYPDDVAFVHRDQVFTGEVEFESLHTELMYVEGDFYATGKISGINLSDFDSNRFSLSKPQEIGENVKVFIENAYIDGDLEVNSINDVVLDKLDISTLTKSEMGDNITYQIENMIVNGSIKTMEIGAYNLHSIKENAIWINRENIITGEIVFEDDVTFENLNVKETVNDYNIDEFLNDIVKKGENVSIYGKKTFMAGFEAENIETTFLNGKCMEDILTTKTNQEILDTLRIKGDVIVEGNLKLESGSINGIKLSKFAERYDWRDGFHVLKGDVEFDELITIDSLNVSGLLNGIDVESFLESLVSVNGDVELIGNVTFKNKVLFKDNVFVEHTVNGVNIEELFGSAVLISNKAPYSSSIRFGLVDGLVKFKNDVVINGALNVYGDMNAEEIYGCNLNEWAEQAIYLDQSQYISGVKIFNRMSSEMEVNIRYLNDVDLHKVIFLNKDQYFNKTLNFKYLSIPNNTNVPVGNLVNGYNLMDEYKNTLLVEGDQLISGQKIFKNPVRIRGNIISEGTINNINISNVVTLHTDQEIKGIVKAKHFVAKEDVRVLGLVNEKDFNQWVDLGVCKDSPRSVISGSWNIRGNVSFYGEDVLGSGVLDGVNISSFYELTSLNSITQKTMMGDMLETLTDICKELKYIEHQAVKQPFLVSGLEAVQKIQPKFKVQSLYQFNALEENYLALSYASECGGELYIWNSIKTNFDLIRKLNFSGSSQWYNLGTINDNVILVLNSYDLGGKCQYPGFNVWRFVAKMQQFEHLQSMEYFKSAQLLTREDSEYNLLYTLGENVVNEWTPNESGMLEKSQSWDHNGEYLSLVPKDGWDVWVINENIATELTGKVIDEVPDVYSTENYIMLQISEKLTLAAFTETEDTVIEGMKDLVKVYDLNDGSLFTKIHTSNPSSLVALDFGLHRQKMLAFLEDSMYLRLFEYKGIEGFVEYISIPVKFSQIISMSLQVRDLFSPHNFIVGLSETSVVVFEVQMLGDPIDEVSHLECPNL